MNEAWPVFEDFNPIRLQNHKQMGGKHERSLAGF